MRCRVVLQLLGKVIILIGLALLIPLVLALYFREKDWLAFTYSAAITLAVGIPLSYWPCHNGEIRRREGYAVVALSWVAAAIFGSLPYIFAGTFPNFADAIFETISGFTTTGASVMTDIEAHSRSILFWRSLTHWLGGMGIVVLFVALLSQLGSGGLQMIQAEAPGPVTEKIKPRIQETAIILWLTYIILSALEILLLLFSGMPLYEAVVHTFGTMATGGFSTKNASIGYYNSPLIQWIIIIFMFLAGVNFALYYQAVKLRNPFYFWLNPEFKLYSAIILAAFIIIVVDLSLAGFKPGENLLRMAAFQVVSIVTTTGYATVDFNQWPNLSRTLLFLLMFVGGCTGSTGGSIKVGRLMVLLKNGIAELFRAVHPHAVVPVRFSNVGIVKEPLVLNILQFIGFYLLLFALGTLLMSLTPLKLEEAASAVAATLGNVGPGLGAVGPAQNYAHLPAAAKYLLSWLMLVGRLEIYTILVLFLRTTWRG
ncbi:Cation transporter [Moorella glycerini]|uniref:Trk system potassium uptake protein TrkH n=1 Tax=Neomoorella stamsii TaxID=1266720 RepID=A0A9X7J3K6_9FIRM|nr:MULTISPECIES: TrkH family potassium uptake protein [Moorella]PRR73047.1 Trk system potassium uptake protein TrkH [Moorella stamsii]CEP69623.1 Cation transporter [Moorella glycerini]